jgi:hypothetical protein
MKVCRKPNAFMLFISPPKVFRMSMFRRRVHTVLLQGMLVWIYTKNCLFWRSGFNLNHRNNEYSKMFKEDAWKQLVKATINWWRCVFQFLKRDRILFSELKFSAEKLTGQMLTDLIKNESAGFGIDCCVGTALAQGRVTVPLCKLPSCIVPPGPLKFICANCRQLQWPSFHFQK